MASTKLKRKSRSKSRKKNDGSGLKSPLLSDEKTKTQENSGPVTLDFAAELKAKLIDNMKLNINYSLLK